MAITTKGVMHSPAHPGVILREMYLKPMKTSITEAADALGVSRKHISSIVNGRLWVVSQKAPPKVKPLRHAA